MEQALWAQALVEVSGEAHVVIEVAWVVLLPRDRAAGVYAPTVVTKKGME